MTRERIAVFRRANWRRIEAGTPGQRVTRGNSENTRAPATLAERTSFGLASITTTALARVIASYVAKACWLLALSPREK